MLIYGAPVPITETKAAKDHWQVTGYASTYSNVDLGYDVVEPGAFDRWLASKGKTRFFYQHDWSKVLGVFPKMVSDKQGLLVTGKISHTVLGEEVYTLIQDGAVDSFSIGYITNKATVDEETGIRHLEDLDVPEASLVSIPMNPEAIVTGWKDMTLAEKAGKLAAELDVLTRELAALLRRVDKPLSNTKQQELTQLLDCVEELAAVRADLQTVLTAAPTKTGRSIVAGHEQRRVLARLHAVRDRYGFESVAPPAPVKQEEPQPEEPDPPAEEEQAADE